MKSKGDLKRRDPTSIEEMIGSLVASVQGVDDPRFNRFWNYKPIPKILEWFKSTKKYGAIIGANKCIDGDTLIFDPVSHGYRTVRCIKKPFHVKAFNPPTGSFVRANAEIPFRKGVESMYRICLHRGKKLECTANHQVMMLNGRYEYVGNLQPSSAVMSEDDLGMDFVDDIEPIGEREVWDFEVPIYHNYIAGGMVNHNSTKTTVGIWKAVAIFTGLLPPSLIGVYPHKLPVNRPRHVRIIVQDYSKHWAETIRPLLLDNDAWGMLPRAWSAWEPSEHMFNGPDGSWLSIIAIDPKKATDPNILRGPLVDHTYIDELTTRMAFTESLTRGATLADGPQSVDLGFCPQEGFDWTWEDIYSKAFNTVTDLELPEAKQHPDYNVIRVSMRDNPSISPEQIETYIHTLHPWEVGYRVDGRYTARAQDPYFDMDTLMRWEREGRARDGVLVELVKEEVDAETGIFKSRMVPSKHGTVGEEGANVWEVWKEPEDGHKYLCPADTAEGNVNSDYQVCDIWDVTVQAKPIQVAQFRKRRIKPGDFTIECCCMATLYDCMFAPEVNNTSGGTVRDRSRNYNSLYKRIRGTGMNVEDTEFIGWWTDRYSKPAALEAAYMVTRAWPSLDDFCGIRSQSTLSEMMSFEETVEKDEKTGVATRIWKPKQGCHDDTIAVLWIMAYIVKNQYDMIEPARIKVEPKKDSYQSVLEKKAKESDSNGKRRFAGLRKSVSFADLSRGRHASNRKR